MSGVKKPTQRAGRIPLAGLVLAHSRHNRVILRAAVNHRHKKTASVGSGWTAVWKRFLGALSRVVRVDVIINGLHVGRFLKLIDNADFIKLSVLADEVLGGYYKKLLILRKA